LGAVTQSAAAFGRSESGLSFFRNGYGQFASYRPRPTMVEPSGGNEVTAPHPAATVVTCLSLTVSAMSLAATVAPSAAATPPVGVTASVLSKHTTGGKDYIVADITIAPGGSTGWHTHRAEIIYGIVKAGELTHYDAQCQQDGVYGAGDPITDPTGPDHVHLARNLGTEPLVLEVTYVDPAGAPTSDSAPNPGCDFQ
jgi:quercetin dioxygenase-like cupin family protein